MLLNDTDVEYSDTQFLNLVYMCPLYIFFIYYDNIIEKFRIVSEWRTSILI